VAPAAGLDGGGIRAFPSPYRRHENVGGVNFVVPVNAEVLIFDGSGELVRQVVDVNSGLAVWDLKNGAGDDVAAGVYGFVVTTTDGNKTRGRLAVIP
jgi:hypothetical protein